MLTLSYSPDIWAHRLSAGVKLAALCLFTVLLFALRDPVSLTVAAAAVGALLASGGGRFARTSLRMLRPLWPFLLIVGLWHLWLDDLVAGGVILLRMLAAVAAANFVTMTTRLTDMIAVVQRLARPLRVLGLNPHALALAVALVIRFIPTMLARATQIAEAWRARSPRRPGWRVLLPTTLAALDDADQVACALRARGGVSGTRD